MKVITTKSYFQTKSCKHTNSLRPYLTFTKIQKNSSKPYFVKVCSFEYSYDYKDNLPFSVWCNINFKEFNSNFRNTFATHIKIYPLVKSYLY